MPLTTPARRAPRQLTGSNPLSLRAQWPERGVIGAVYARRSHEQNVSDEERSVTRQTELAMACAQKLGYEVRAEYVFVDDAISGAEFERLAGRARLLNALKPRPPFSALFVADKDRLGREQFETSYTLKLLSVAGVKIFEYQHGGQEVRLDSPVDKLIMSVSNFAAEVERTKASQRTYDALRLKAQKGYVGGGIVFGYRNVVVFSDDGQRAYVVREVREDEAAIVVRIFELSASGLGFVKIAKLLNAEGIRPPRTRGGRHPSWTPGTVRAILYNPIYTGELVWGRTKKRDIWGRQKPSARPSGEWVRTHAEPLRIVSDELWRRVHDRLAAMEKPFAPLRGALRGRSRAPRYLLTGLAKCGLCGGPITSDVIGRYAVYRCAYNATRGASVCANATKVRTEIADPAILDALVRDVLTADVVAVALDLALAELSRPGPGLGITARQEELKAELARLEGELAKYAEAIADVGPVDSLLTSVKMREERRRAIREELKALKPQTNPPVRSRPAIHADLRQRLADWRALAGCGVAEARDLLRALLLDRLTLTSVPCPVNWKPTGPGRRPTRVYRFTAALTLAPVFEGLIWAIISLTHLSLEE